MKKVSAGLLLYRMREGEIEVLLVHPGGPFWAKKDLGAWSVPKGEAEEGEDLLEVACREFEEETGQAAPKGEMHYLDTVKLSSGKVIHVWATEGELDASQIMSNTFSMVWPPKSGQQQEFPEVDKAEWFDLSTAITKINKAQTEFITRLAEHLGIDANIQPEAPQQSLF